MLGSRDWQLRRDSSASSLFFKEGTASLVWRDSGVSGAGPRRWAGLGGMVEGGRHKIVEGPREILYYKGVERYDKGVERYDKGVVKQVPGTAVISSMYVPVGYSVR